MLAFGGIRWNLDTTYTKEKFEQIYIEQNDIESFNKKSKVIGVGITGVKIKTAQEGYVDECMKLYKIFKIKTYGILGAHLLLNILLIYQVLKLSEKNAKKERVNKDDLILFDEEQDIRF